MSSNFIKIFTGLIPVIFSTWTRISDRPVVKSLIEGQEILEEKIYALGAQIRWLYFLIIVLFIWNLVLSTLLYLNLYM